MVLVEHEKLCFRRRKNLKMTERFVVHPLRRKEGRKKEKEGAAPEQQGAHNIIISTTLFRELSYVP